MLRLESRQEGVASLQLHQLNLVLSLHDRNRVFPLLSYTLGLNRLNHSLRIHDLPPNEPLQDLIGVLHHLREVLQLVLQVVVVFLFEKHVLGRCQGRKHRGIHEARHVVLLDQPFDGAFVL